MKRRLRVWLALAGLAAWGVALPQAENARVYVKRIDITGTSAVDDTVLRRRLLQLEGSYLNTTALETSRQRLERLPYIERAETRLEPVPDAADQVIVVIQITEAPPRRYQVGGGYSESLGASVRGFFVNENLMGSGHRIAVGGQVSEIRAGADLSYTNPFAIGDVISSTVSLRYRDVDQLTLDASDLQADALAAQLDFELPVGAAQAATLGLVLQQTELSADSATSAQLSDWIASNGDTATDGGTPSTDFFGADLQFAWQSDSRPRSGETLAGTLQRAALRVAIPGSDVSYATFDYRLTHYRPLVGGWTGKIAARLGYGESYRSDTTSMPPNLHWFAGGPRTVRGYAENELGPRDSLGNPYGGNLLVAGQFELIAPLPSTWRRYLQLAAFYDVGNVFATEGVSFADDAGTPLDYGFELSELRQSVGVAVDIRLPVGTLGLSYGVPLNADDDNPNRFLRDRVREFQVIFGWEF